MYFNILISTVFLQNYLFNEIQWGSRQIFNFSIKKFISCNKRKLRRWTMWCKKNISYALQYLRKNFWSSFHLAKKIKRVIITNYKAGLNCADDFTLNFLINTLITSPIIWDKVFKNGTSKNCGRQPPKYLKEYGLLKQTILLQIF